MSNLHGKQKKWWQPDGTEITNPPYQGMKNASEKYKYELVIKYAGPSDVVDRWDIQGGNYSTNTGAPNNERGNRLEELRVYGIGFPSKPALTNVRYGVTVSNWKTLADFNFRNTTHASQAWPGGGVTFSSPYEKDNKTFINVSSTKIKDATRVVAIKKSGAIIISNGISGTGVTGLTSRTYRFFEPLEQIEKFEFQTRPFEWVEFKNVSLIPQNKTEVKIIENRPSSITEIYPGIQRKYVGKMVLDFPDRVDTSSPEAAAASWNRAWASADTDAILKLHAYNISRSETENFWKRRENIYNKALLNSEIVEVLTYRNGYSQVITCLKFPQGKGRHPYSLRSFGLFDGQWKNLGEDRCPSVEAGREIFNRKKERLWQSYQKMLNEYKATEDVKQVSQDVKNAAKELFEKIRSANYEYILSKYNNGKWENDAWKQFPASNDYMVRSSWPSFVLWICKTFKNNPIISVELGEVFKGKKKFLGKTGWPTVPYKLILKDGTILKGNLAFEYNYDGGRGHWHGMEGIDWHHMYPNGLKPQN